MIRGWAFLVVFLAVVLPAVERGVRLDILPMLDARLEGLEDWRPPTVVRVVDRRGAPLDQFSLVRRIWVPLDEIPDVMWQAVVASEDARYFDHVGVDPLGILRAFWVNLRAGRIVEGGSTLTQQLVKNVVVGSERSYARKLEEALLAWRLDRKLGKRQVLELYLNYVYLGSGNYGVEAAALDYFGVHASELDAGSAALLAGLIPAPSTYSPRRNPVVAEGRRDLVLQRMVHTQALTAEQAQEAREAPVDPPRRGVASEVGMAYVTAVRREVRRLLGEQLPFEVGLTVHTPYDPEVQAVAEQAVRDAAAAVERRQGPKLEGKVLSGEALAAFLHAAEGLPRVGDEPSRPGAGACFPSVLVASQSVQAGGYRFPIHPASWWGKVWTPTQDDGLVRLREVVEEGEVLMACLRSDGQVDIEGEPYVEGAAVVLDTKTAEVLALVGGRTVSLEGFVRATQARRQAGSSFKPYLYAAAMQAGVGLMDPVLDAPISLPGSRGTVWSPQNYSGGYRGELSLRSAFAYSLNTVAVRLILQVGAQRVASLAKRAGINTPLRADSTLALGTSEVTVLDHAAALAGIVRGGVARSPVLVRELEDMLGRPVGRAGERVSLPGVELVLPGEAGARFLDAGVAWEVVELMRATVLQGTGVAARRPSQERGGKTGTTSGYADAWFVGFTPEHTIAVWIGQDTRQSLGMGETGGRAALPAWVRIAEVLPAGAPTLTRPPEVVPVPIGGEWVSVRPSEVSRELLGWSPPPTDAPLPRFPTPVPARCEPEEADPATAGGERASE